VFPRAAVLFGIPTTVGGKGVLLTFDDGPHPDGTPAVLEELDRLAVSAVFFVTGEQVERYPQLVGAVAAAGHELGLHGYRHQTRRQWSARLLADDVRRACEAVEDAAGTSPRLYRPPHGVFTLTGLRVIHELGLDPLLWSKWGRDWERRATPETIAARATANLAPGDVLLLHDADHYSAHESWRMTAAALGPIVDRIVAAGLQTASI
jgi:peptidoglycan/xylan/chitin deacetylase (PgdA/CDA1 family)